MVMAEHGSPGGVGARSAGLLHEIARLVPEMQDRAPRLDAEAAFPVDDIAALRELSVLTAPVPIAYGGLGWGTDPEGALYLVEALRLLGRANLSLGRIYEAHVNTLRLVARFGTVPQLQQAAADAMAGHLFALWVTDDRRAPLQLHGLVLQGAKAPCSAAGHAQRALVTATLPSGEERMLVIDATGAVRVESSGWQAQGMRAACNGRVVFDGVAVADGAAIGRAGDYLRQPDFSAGAWRASAVALGGMEALVRAMRDQIVARGRQDDPHQRARIGKALIAQETAILWVKRAATIAEAQDRDAADMINTVNLARIAVEAACLDVLRIVQRGLGLAAFRCGDLVELLLRDLATYLRQPAPDEALTEAAGHFMRRDLPPWP
jgi:hypothetical protein